VALGAPAPDSGLYLRQIWRPGTSGEDASFSRSCHMAELYRPVGQNASAGKAAQPFGSSSIFRV
jgi:hypothetical protein